MLEFNKGVRTDTIFNIVHEEIYSRFELNEKAARDNPRAMEMERLLKELKATSTDRINSIDDAFSNQAEELVATAINALNVGRKGVKGAGQFGGTIFSRSYGTATAFGGDDIFEEELAAIIAAIEFKATDGNIPINIGGKLVGSQTSNVKLLKDLNQFTKDAMTEVVQKGSAKITENITGGKERLYDKPMARSGKIDVNGTSGSAELVADLNPKWEKLYSLFQNTSFSVKNYSSFVKAGTSPNLNIHLGNTDYFKAFYGTLSAAGYDQDFIEQLFCRSLNRLNNNTVAKHFYHVRFIYELTGVGLYDQSGNPISGVDFFIYNDPSSSNIFVRSTAQMILDELDRKPSGSVLKEINIHKNRFGETYD